MIRRLAPAALLCLTLVACGQKTAAPAATDTPSAPEAAATPATAPQAPAPTDAETKAALAALPAPYNAADLENGHRQWAKCKSCHTSEKGAPNMVGPNLYGVIGRKAGSKADYSYSDGMKAAGWTWDAAHLDTWLTDPRTAVPGTRMTFVGIRDPKDRSDLIAWLMVNTKS